LMAPRSQSAMWASLGLMIDRSICPLSRSALTGPDRAGAGGAGGCT